MHVNPYSKFLLSVLLRYYESVLLSRPWPYDLQVQGAISNPYYQVGIHPTYLIDFNYNSNYIFALNNF